MADMTVNCSCDNLFPSSGFPTETPLRLEIGSDLGSNLAEWPMEHAAKVLCFYHPDHPPELREEWEEMAAKYQSLCDL